jgi:hypothetical protein
MALSDIRTTVTRSTPVLAAVGATDLAVERVRAVAADLEKAVATTSSALEPAAVQARVQKVLDPKVVSTTVQQVPALAVARVLEAAGRVETGYADLAERGKGIVTRVRSQKATQDLLAQGRSTVTLTRAAVTTARKAVDETTAAALSAVTVGRREVKETGEAVEQQVEQSVAATEKVVADRTSGTRAAAKRTARTARKGADRTRTAAGEARTSARKAAKAAEKAVEDGAEKVGD